MSQTPARPERAALHAFIARHQRFLLTTHVNPDGDAIGSEVAFARWLRAAGKQVRILNDSPTPKAFAWLADEGPIEVYSEPLAETRFAEAKGFLPPLTKHEMKDLAGLLQKWLAAYGEA